MAGSFVFVVRDTGAGISKENLTSLFTEGVQFHAHLLQCGGGSGLGLWITKGISELHGGTITGHSDGEGLGSVFTFRLPARVNKSQSYIDSNLSLSQSASQHRQTDKTKSQTAVVDDVQRLKMTFSGLGMSRVLVVDDAPSSRKIVCRLLRLAGCEHVEAVHGQDSIDKYKDPSIFPTPPDLILMDYEMPM